MNTTAQKPVVQRTPVATACFKSPSSNTQNSKVQNCPPKQGTESLAFLTQTTPYQQEKREAKTDQSEENPAKTEAQPQPFLLNRLEQEKTCTRTKELIDFLDGRNENLHKRCSLCGDYMLFEEFKSGKKRLKKGRFCGVWKLCPICANRRARNSKRTLCEFLRGLRSANPKLVLYFGLLTIKDGCCLKERFERMILALKKLHQRRDNAKKGKTQSAFLHAENVIFIFEINRGENSKLWHVHVHFIWIGETAPVESEIAKEWHKLTGATFVKSKEIEAVKDDTLEEAVERVVGYCLKPSDLSIPDAYVSAGVKMG